MTIHKPIGTLQVATPLYDFINNEALPGTGISRRDFWRGFEQIINDLTPRNSALLKTRERLQRQLNEWHKRHGIGQFDNYKRFLQDIGYLSPVVADFRIPATQVDNEIAVQAGPQLVVPATNARFALNAANARWGSLYDALYSSDVIEQAPLLGHRDRQQRGYDPIRGEKVIAYGRRFLDKSVPLVNASHTDATGYAVRNGALCVRLSDGSETGLRNPGQFKGYRGDAESPAAILLENHQLHIEIQIDSTQAIGNRDRAGIQDILLEAALTTIIDLEDSIAAVDAEDKTQAYRNWLGLMTGQLQAEVSKNGRHFIRQLSPDRVYRSAQGTEFHLPGRSLLLIRNVGHLMTSPAMLDAQGNEVFEGIMDAVITSLIALQDLLGNGSIGDTPIRNSLGKNIYIVKPKLHGAEEAAFTCELFSRVEELLKLSANTLKIGIMDEERRTSVNLKACIFEARERIAFINTGFLDRTGDEIHTSMEAGPFAPKAQLKTLPWIRAYEKLNVDSGLACGLQGKAQIGKGMWPMPDNMADMMIIKIAHPQAGANTAWVPSPTAATLHSMHYHAVDVASVQDSLKSHLHANADDLLQIPLLGSQTLTAIEIQQELDNNVQGILGYVVRWIDQGIGCSKVPDINNIGLMEDRATLRISSQHVANWMHHGLCTEQQVMDTLKRMARVVDQQNARDPAYRPMAPKYQGIAFQAACDLIFNAMTQPNGYTEPLLHQHRLVAKQQG